MQDGVPGLLDAPMDRASRPKRSARAVLTCRRAWVALGDVVGTRELGHGPNYALSRIEVSAPR